MASSSANHDVTVANTYSNANPASQGFVIFDSITEGFKPTELLVGCQPSSTGTIYVNVQGLHTGDKWFPIYAGGSQIFRYKANGITKIVVSTDATNAATIDWGVVSRGN